jgi:hypothetical protein
LHYVSIDAEGRWNIAAVSTANFENRARLGVAQPLRTPAKKASAPKRKKPPATAAKKRRK